MAAPAPPILESYAVLAQIGSGGIATVYKVRYEPLGTLRALKVLANPTADVAQRLRREGRVQAQLKHPHVVQVYDVVEVGGQPGLVMEFVDGPTLAQFLAAGPLPLDEIGLLGTGILRGVAAAHDAGWTHRDLKPSNVLLEVLEGRLVPKVADFGLAKVLSGTTAIIDPTAAKTPSGAVLGTWRYMAPEQLHRLPTDTRTDVFALGSVLYELVTGQPAFDSPSLATCSHLIATGQYTDVLELRPDLPEARADLIRAALRVDPADRPADAGALLKAWGTTGTGSALFSAVSLDRARQAPPGSAEAPTATYEGSAIIGVGAGLLGSGQGGPVSSPPRARRWSWALALGMVSVGSAVAMTWPWTDDDGQGAAVDLTADAATPAPGLTVLLALPEERSNEAVTTVRGALEGVLPGPLTVATGRAPDRILGDLIASGTPTLALTPPPSQDIGDGVVQVGSLIWDGWGAHAGSWLLTPAPLSSPETLSGATLCHVGPRSGAGALEPWLQAHALNDRTTVRQSEAPDASCSGWVSDHHGEREALQAIERGWSLSELTGPPPLLLLGAASHDDALEGVRSQLGQLSVTALAPSAIRLAAARGPVPTTVTRLESVAPARPVPAPTPPPRATPAPPPEPSATVRVRTVGGPAGTFTLDDGSAESVGWRNPQPVSAGPHRLRIYPRDSDTPVYDTQIELVESEERSICFDLAASSLCP